MDKPGIEILNTKTCRLVSTLANKHMFYGFPYGGAMDGESAKQAHAILNQELKLPLLECSLKAAKITFKSKLKIALTGADMSWQIDGVSIKMNQVIEVKEGQVLSGKYTKTGLRTYIAFNRIIQEWDDGSIFFGKLNKVVKSTREIKSFTKLNNELVIQKGPEWNLLDQDSKENMISFEGVISQDMDRMGAYIQGPKISIKTSFPKTSVCTFPGVIQLLPDGQVIVLLQDAQTTGGYPRIAYFNADQLNQFNQLAPGHKIKWRLMF